MPCSKGEEDTASIIVESSILNLTFFRRNIILTMKAVSQHMQYSIEIVVAVVDNKIVVTAHYRARQVLQFSLTESNRSLGLLSNFL